MKFLFIISTFLVSPLWSQVEVAELPEAVFDRHVLLVHRRVEPVLLRERAKSRNSEYAALVRMVLHVEEEEGEGTQEEEQGQEGHQDL